MTHIDSFGLAELVREAVANRESGLQVLADLGNGEVMLPCATFTKGYAGLHYEISVDKELFFDDGRVLLIPSRDYLSDDATYDARLIDCTLDPESSELVNTIMMFLAEIDA